MSEVYAAMAESVALWKTKVNTAVGDASSILTLLNFKKDGKDIDGDIDVRVFDALRTLKADLIQLREQIDKQSTVSDGASGTSTPSTQKKKKCVSFSEEVLRHHDQQAVTKVLTSRRKRKEQQSTEAAWHGRGLTPETEKWMSSILQPRWCKQLQDANKTASEVLSSSNSARDENDESINDDDDVGETAFDEGVLWEESSQLEQLVSNVVTKDLAEVVRHVPQPAHEHKRPRGQSTPHAHIQQPHNTAETPNNSNWRRAYIKEVAGFVNNVFCLFFTEVPKGMIFSFCEEWLQWIPTTSSRQQSSSSRANSFTLQYFTILRSMETLRCTAVQLCQCRRNHALFFSTFSRLEIVSTLFAALLTGTAPIGMSNEDVEAHQVPMSLLFGLAGDHLVQEQLSCYVGFTLLLKDNANFVLHLLNRGRLPSSPIAGWRLSKQFHTLCTSLVKQSSLSSHSSLHTTLRTITTAKNIAETERFNHTFFAAVLHISVLGFHTMKPHDDCVLWIQRWAAARQYIVGSVKDLVEFERGFGTVANKAQYVADVQSAVIQHALFPLLNIVHDRFFADVVVAEQHTRDDEQLGEAGYLLIPNDWEVNMHTNTAFLEQMQQAECQRVFGKALSGEKIRISEMLRTNMAPVCTLLLNTPVDPTASFVAESMHDTTLFSSGELDSAAGAALGEQLASPDGSANPPPAEGSLLSILGPGLTSLVSESTNDELQNVPQRHYDDPIVVALHEARYIACRFLDRELKSLLQNPPTGEARTFERMLGKTALNWAQCLIDLNEHLRGKIPKQHRASVAPLISHPTQFDPSLAFCRPELRSIFDTPTAALAWCFEVAHLPPPHPTHVVQNGFFMDAVTLGLTHLLVHAAEAHFVGQRSGKMSSPSSVPVEQLSTHPRSLGSMNTILDRYNRFSQRVEKDDRTKESWARAKRFLYRHQ